MSTLKLTVKHVTAARGLLEMTQAELAEAAGVAKQTIVNLEAGRHHPQQSTLDAIQTAFERRGVEFLNGDSPGVRLRAEKAVIPLH